MSEKNITEFIIKIVSKQQIMINSLSKLVTDLSALTLSFATKCDADDCHFPATLHHENKHMCDTHATSHIANRKSNIEDWIDDPNIERIRNISDYIKIVRDMEKGPTIH